MRIIAKNSMDHIQLEWEKGIKKYDKLVQFRMSLEYQIMKDEEIILKESMILNEDFE